MSNIQGNINQLLALTTGAVGLVGKPASEQELANAVAERDLAKSYYERAENTLKGLNKNFSEEELENIEEREGLQENLTPERELELKHKYSNKGILGRRKLAQKYKEDKYAYEYNESLTQTYRNNILDKLERDKQARKDSIKRVKEYKKDKVNQLKDMKTSLGRLKDLDENLQYKIIEVLKKEEVNKK